MARDQIKPGQYFEYKQGIEDFPGWKGMQLDNDPATMDPNGLALALNMRLEQGNWRNRWGLNQIVQLPDSFGTTGPGSITWLGMHHLQFDPPKLWLASYGCFGVGTEPGAFLEWYNPDKSPELQAVANFISQTDRVPVIAPFDGDMYFGDYVLYRPTVIEPLRGEHINISSRQSYTSEIFGANKSFPFEITAMQEFDSKLFIAFRDPAGAASFVGYWDGVNLKQNDLVTGATNGINFCKWGDSRLVMIQNTSNTAQIRDLSGTWTPVLLPGAITNTAKNSMVEFKNKVFIANGLDVYGIDNFGAPNAAIYHSLAPNHISVSAAVLNDQLFYLWNDMSTPPPHRVWLGCYEPEVANWNDSYHQIDTDIPGTNLGLAAGAATLINYRNKLWAGGAYSTLVTHTVPGDPSSTWWEARTGGLAKQYIAAMRVGG